MFWKYCELHRISCQLNHCKKITNNVLFTVSLVTCIIFYNIHGIRAVENNIRIILQDDSATTGRIEIYHDGSWGVVCVDGGFTIQEANATCKQLGYDSAISFFNAPDSGQSDYKLSQVRCLPEHRSLHDCNHAGWNIHSCNSAQNLAVQCNNGVRKNYYDIFRTANHYWSCDNVVAGVPYDFRDNQQVMVYGTSQSVLSPLDAGINLEGKSSWANLGNFASNPCLSDLNQCHLSIAFWAKVSHRQHSLKFLLGNSYKINNILRGFTVYTIEGNKIAVELKTSNRKCVSHRSHFGYDRWFHFTLVWQSDTKTMKYYLDGHMKKSHACTGASNTLANQVYFLGADESLAGDTNDHFKVSFDELAFWFHRKLTKQEVERLANLPRDIGGFSQNTINLKIATISWNPSYSDPNSPIYIDTINGIEEQIFHLYNNTGSSYTSGTFDFQDRGGVLGVNLHLTFSDMEKFRGFYLTRLFYQNKFLDSAVEIVGCISKMEFCDAPEIITATAHSGGKHLSITYSAVMAHYADPLFQGYMIVAESLKSSNLYLHHRAPEIGKETDFFHFHLTPNTFYNLTIVAYSWKGTGFVFGNTVQAKTVDAPPSSGPQDVIVYDVTTTRVCVNWTTIARGHRNGIIQKYHVTIRDFFETPVGIQLFNMSDPRTTCFDNLYPGQHYEVMVCGYSRHPECGISTIRFKQTVPILPIAPPENLAVSDISVHKVGLRWQRVPFWTENGDMKYYQFNVTNLKTNQLEQIVKYTVVYRTTVNYNMELSSLQGLTPYLVNLFMVSEVGHTSHLNVTFVTEEGVPTLPPGNLTDIRVTTETITMQWLAISSQIHGVLKGYVLEYRLKDSDTWSNITTSNLTATVSSLSLQLYEFRVCGYTVVGLGVFTEIKPVKSGGDAPIVQPSDFNVVVTRNESFEITWRFNTAPTRPVHFFLIVVRRQQTNVTILNETFDVENYIGDVYSYHINGLQEYEWYSISIAGGNKVGIAPFFTITNRTAEGVPSSSPRNLTASNASSTSILVKWLPVLEEYEDGVIQGYMVYWRAEILPAQITWNIAVINSSNNTQATISGLQKFTSYYFKVCAFTVIDCGPTTSVTVKTDEDVPGHSPVNVAGYNTSSTSLRLQWQPVPSAWHFGIILGYQVNILNTRDRGITYHRLSNNEESYETTGLQQYTNYSVQIAAFTMKGTGNLSDPILVSTDEDVPSEGPGNIVCADKTSTSLQFTWDVLPVAKARGILLYYHIYLERIDGQESTKYCVKTYNETTCSFFALDQYTDYGVIVSASTVKGEGNKSVMVTCKTDEDVPHAPPQNLSGYNTSDTSLQIFWEEVPVDDQNGIIIEYDIHYNTTLRNGQISSHFKTVAASERTATLQNLLPFKHYDIHIAAKTSKGSGNLSSPIRIRTEEEAPKISPSNVRAFNTSSTSMTLSWLKIPSEMVGGILGGYKIQWNEINYDDTVLSHNEIRLDDIDRTSQNFTGLTKYQKYTFRILAFTKFDGVFSADAAALTDEDIPSAAPTDCTGFNISKNEIKTLWKSVPRKERNGIIIGYNITFDEAKSISLTRNTITDSLSFLHDSLKPYLDYKFEIAAFTSKGQGPKCDQFIVRTEQEAPQYAPNNLTAFNSSSTSLIISWNALNQTLIHGIFRGYVIYFTAKPEFPDAYLTYGEAGVTEHKRKRRALFSLSEQHTTVGIQQNQIEIENLAKYTNYTIYVSGFTKFIGLPSINITLLTDQDIPSKTPQNFQGYNISSTSLQMSWSPVPDGFVHGILLGYRIYFRVTNLPSMPFLNVTLAPTIQDCVIDDLWMFTNYTLHITAFTSKGEGPLTSGIIVCTDEDVASKAPFAFKVTTLIKTHDIPMTWQPVPNGFLNGILIGYRIKMRHLSEGMEDINGEEKHIDVDRDTLQYTVKNLPNFSTYTFQIVALTKYGEGVHSRVIVAKTCACEKNLTTNWHSLPPYTNHTADGSIHGIFPWLLNNYVKECCGNCYNGHGWSETFYHEDGKGNYAHKLYIDEFKSNIDDDTNFHFPVEGHSLTKQYRTFYGYVYSVGSPGIAFFIVDDPPEKMPNALFQAVSSCWSLVLICFLLSFIAGTVVWFLDTSSNQTEFPQTFFSGSWQGLWWAFVSLTTVGYGDKAPKSIIARLFAIFWILSGLIICSILMGSITNALTTMTVDVANLKLYGTKVAAIDDSPSHRVGIRRNAIVNPDHPYYDTYALQKDLVDRKVKGVLIDGYMAGSYHELFEDKNIQVHEIIDYNTGYGMVLGGDSKRLQKCIQHFGKRRKSDIVDFISSQIHIVKKNPKNILTERSTNLFNPEARIFVLTALITVVMLVISIIGGLCLQVYFKRRQKQQQHSLGADWIGMKTEFNESVESFKMRMNILKQELFNKHKNEIRLFHGLEPHAFQYKILPEVLQDDDRFLHLLSDSCSTAMIRSSFMQDSQCDEIEAKGNIIGLVMKDQLSSGKEYDQISDDRAITTEVVKKDIITPDKQPSIEELQRQAYLSNSPSAQHPYSQLYKYLWVEQT